MNSNCHFTVFFVRCKNQEEEEVVTVGKEGFILNFGSGGKASFLISQMKNCKIV